MEINRKDVLKGFLDNIYRISDKGYQKRIWIDERGPECHSFDEAVCEFFGDVDPIIKSYKDYGIAENQYRILFKFREAFRAFSDSHDYPELFIDSSEWARIMDMAKEVLEAFNYHQEK